VAAFFPCRYPDEHYRRSKRVSAIMSTFDKRRIEAVRTLEALGYKFTGGTATSRTQPPRSPAAQAQVAGLLQGVGELYGDERLKAEGEKLSRGERCGAAVADQRGS
jgi:hypothetical protein